MTDSLWVREALLHAVDQGFGVPGETVKAVIYRRIEVGYHIRREDIPDNLETFRRALLELLGAGAPVVERIIAKNLYRIIGLDFTEHDNWTLVDYVNHAKDSKNSPTRRRQ
jgi:hypothetical protein